MSPVAMLKQAPCQGHRTWPFDNTPAKEGRGAHWDSILQESHPSLGQHPTRITPLTGTASYKNHTPYWDSILQESHPLPGQHPTRIT
ncbi:hypothetical protein ANANG_G00188340, partial [Anguilla anguilla]